jgi:hypothetical protein
MLMQKLDPQPARPPIAITRAGARRVIEGALALRGGDGGGCGYGAFVWHNDEKGNAPHDAALE